jgi:hypothetical protein
LFGSNEVGSPSKGKDGRKTSAPSALEALESIGLFSSTKTDKCDLPKPGDNCSDQSFSVPPNSCRGSPKLLSDIFKKDPTTTTKVKASVSPANSNSNPKEPPALVFPSMIDIGLQTDLEEDPDIFYFAGGRNVASQTEYTDDYPPLTSICFKSSPVILVLNTSDSDGESSSLVNESATNNNQFDADNNIVQNEPCPSVVGVTCDSNNSININGETVLVTTTAPSPSHADVSSSVMTSSALINCDRPTTPIETKSSATQLSAGVLLDESPPEVKEKESSSSNSNNTDPSKVENNDENDKVLNSSESTKYARSETAIITSNEPSPVVVPTKSTFAEKAKNGMLKTQAKSVSSYLNKVGLCSSSSTGCGGNGKSTPSGSLQRGKSIAAPSSGARPTSAVASSSTGGVGRGRVVSILGTASLSGSISSSTRPSSVALIQSKVKVPTIPNYRSNIASRCRTAVNTGQAPLQVNRCLFAITDAFVHDAVAASCCC